MEAALGEAELVRAAVDIVEALPEAPLVEVCSNKSFKIKKSFLGF